MNDLLILMLSCLSGAALGTVFFGGLWWTIRRGLSSEWPAPWFFGSLVLRMILTLAGFYLIGVHHWERLLLGLLGFLLARFAVTWLTQPVREKRIDTIGGQPCT